LKLRSGGGFGKKQNRAGNQSKSPLYQPSRDKLYDFSRYHLLLLLLLLLLFLLMFWTRNFALERFLRVTSLDSKAAADIFMTENEKLYTLERFIVMKQRLIIIHTLMDFLWK